MTRYILHSGLATHLNLIGRCYYYYYFLRRHELHYIVHIPDNVRRWKCRTESSRHTDPVSDREALLWRWRRQRRHHNTGSSATAVNVKQNQNSRWVHLKQWYLPDAIFYSLAVTWRVLYNSWWAASLKTFARSTLLAVRLTWIHLKKTKQLY